RVGSGKATALTDGNYVVVSPEWNGGVGAATFGNGSEGVAGPVSDTNSLVGGAPGDRVGGGVAAFSASDGANGILVLLGGAYVVLSPNWDGTRGAATYGPAGEGVFGAISSANSLVGDT